MITQELEENIQFTYADARERGLEYVTIEHLLLTMLDNDDVLAMCRNLEADVESLRTDLGLYIETKVPKLGAPNAGQPRPTMGFQRIIQRAVLQARNSGRKSVVSGTNVLAAIYSEPDSFAVHYLQKHGLARRAVVQHLSPPRRGLSNKLSDSGESPHAQRHRSRSRSGQQSGFLDEFAVNLTDEAAAGRLEEPVLRRDLIDRVVRTLCRKYKRNPILVGDAGVGKTTIVHSLAHQIAAGEVPRQIEDLQIYSVDICSLVAGTKYRGDFEQRIQMMLKELEDKEQAAVFFDEIHSLLGAGSVSGGPLDAANILKPALTLNNLRCIGAVNHGEYSQVFKKDSALSRRFLMVEVPEPNDAEALETLKSVSSKLEKHHGVTFAGGTLESTIHLSRRYLPERFLPDKAIDVLDEAATRHSLAGTRGKISENAVAEVISSLARVPVQKVNQDERRALRSLDRLLSGKVFGQENAVNQVVSAVRRSRVGLSKPGQADRMLPLRGAHRCGQDRARAAARRVARHTPDPH